MGKEYDDLSPEDKEATKQGGENEASSYPDMPDDMGPEPEPEPKAKPKSPKKMAAGGKVGGRGDGCCTKGKTKGRFV